MTDHFSIYIPKWYHVQYSLGSEKYYLSFSLLFLNCFLEIGLEKSGWVTRLFQNVHIFFPMF